MTDPEKLAKEIQDNLEFFKSKLDNLLGDHRDRYALLRRMEIIGIYDTIRDAKTSGDNMFADGLFSIQKITDKSVDLGVFSHALHLGPTQ